MKPTADDFEPRRDGWFEHDGTWQEVVVGTVIGSKRSRTQRWEIIDVAHGQQVEYGHTLWMRARDQVSGAEYTVDPRVKTSRVMILTQSPADTKTGDPTWPSDSEAIQLLIRELGAVHLATRDETTGEITCPDYAAGQNHLDGVGNGALQRGLTEHLRFAHALPISDDQPWLEVFDYHGHAHNPKYDIGKGGFPHRHVPEPLHFL